MNRRGFLASIVAAVAARFAPRPAGISIKAIQSFTLEGCKTRFDVLYGYAALPRIGDTITVKTPPRFVPPLELHKDAFTLSWPLGYEWSRDELLSTRDSPSPAKWYQRPIHRRS